jgi:Fe-S cluster biogenesis protein NfuA
VSATAPTKSEIELGYRVQACLDDQIRPLLQSHGGEAEIASIDDGVVTLRFLAACRACHYKSWTSVAVVESRLLKIDGVEEVQIEGAPLSRQARERARAFLAGDSHPLLTS